MRILAGIVAAGLLAGCADRALDRQEGAVLQALPITPRTDLAGQSRHAAALSRAYVAAAREATTVQDLASFVVFLSAGSVVAGAVGSASDTALANRALVGAGTQLAAQRTVPKSAINGIYSGAKRMNCLATMSAAGREILAGAGDPTLRAAQAITHGAITEVRITTREALVREVAEYGALVETLTDALPDRTTFPGAPEEEQPADRALLKAYLALLAPCLADGSLQKAKIES